MFVTIAVALVIGYWFLRRQQNADRPLTDQDAIAEMQSRAQRAVADAKSEYGVDLDFSPDSIQSLESILEQVHQSHAANSISETELTRHALKWGGYLGEVIKQVQTAEWKLNSQINGEGSLPIVYEDESESFPVAWCHKRIVNGDEDNVWTKFTILVVNRDADLGQFEAEEH
ncbi:hypothetical protein C5Y96_10415 [Blastopirellula marina]|uniref:Uncharacterized protein n=2 Tax=Pirellulales TaxID=2691354 RepID=A0A2S8FM34_9BACT|nr:hypothetical protein C5Y96_10415 [Blastopirellula marina]RCS52347.1 hypothetical protein DTL36_10425 [Bremerella cremea]